MARCTAPVYGHRTSSGAAACPACGGRSRSYGYGGGYSSLPRRMYRLAHISFFGLGAVNLLFWLTVKNSTTTGGPLGLASGAFALGAVTMPLCCVLMAHWPKARMLFAVPVLSLLTGGGLTLQLLWNNTIASL